MMQIDCQVVDTKFVNVRKSSIPVPYGESSFFYSSESMPVTSPTEYNSQNTQSFTGQAQNAN